MNFTRESIFVSATRSLCNSFAVVIGVLLASIVAFFIIAMMSNPEVTPPPSNITVAPDAEGNRELLSERTPAILRINLHGVIGEGALTTEVMENVLLDSREYILKNDRVKAILLHVNTPGGTVTDSDGIYKLLMNYKKQFNTPIYAFVDGLCASGGMYITSSADKIYATTPSVIGSVGVIMGPTFNFADAMDKIGVKQATITEGKDKDMLNPFRPWKPDETACLANITKSLYQNFVSIVTQARKGLNADKLVNQYGAQVYVAKQALDYGYIEVADSNYSQCLKDLAAAANISESEKYQVVQLSSELVSC